MESLHDGLINAIAGAVDASDKLKDIDDAIAAIEFISDELETAQYIERIKAAAGRGHGAYIDKAAKIFKKRQMALKRDLASQNESKFSELPAGLTEQIKTGPYAADDFGIREPIDGIMTPVSSTPIIPVRRLQNMDDNTEHIELAYLKDTQWRTLLTDLQTLSERKSITSLAAYGTGINSENAQSIVRYVAEVLGNNITRIPVTASTSRMGWIGSEFIPYTETAQFDGDVTLKSLYQAVHTAGDESAWRECVTAARAASAPMRLYLDAALAAPILQRLGKTTFFCHIWGTSQFGKTVAMLVAASLYGDPNEGALFRSMSSTAVGMTQIAGTMCNLPLFLDEAESVKDRADAIGNVLYLLTQGVSKSKGTRGGGMAEERRWRTVILTNGEAPLTDSDSKTGAINRVYNIECKKPLFDDPAAVAACVRRNYGWAGRAWIDILRGMTDAELDERLHDCEARIRAVSRATGKQLDYAAVLLLADELSMPLFGGDALDIADVARNAVCLADINTFARAYEMVKDWVASSQVDFLPEAGPSVIENAEPEVVGTRHALGRFRRGGAVAIIASELKSVLSEHGYSYDVFVSAAEDAGAITERDGDAPGRRTKTIRIGSTSAKCVVLKL